MPVRLLAALALLTGCTAAPGVVPRPASTVPVIVLSAGTSEWGYSATEVYADDTVITVMSDGIRHPVHETARTVPGAFDRVAAVIRRDGPAAVRATGPEPAICPGARDAIGANPPLGGFAVLHVPCGGDAGPFHALYSAALWAIAPR